MPAASTMSPIRATALKVVRRESEAMRVSATMRLPLSTSDASQVWLKTTTPRPRSEEQTNQPKQPPTAAFNHRACQVSPRSTNQSPPVPVDSRRKKFSRLMVFDLPHSQQLPWSLQPSSKSPLSESRPYPESATAARPGSSPAFCTKRMSSKRSS